ADFARLDGVERSPGEPDEHRRESEEQDSAAAEPFAAPARSARRQLAKALLDAADDFFEVASRRRPERSLAPRPAPRRAPRSAALMVPGHPNLLSAAGRYVVRLYR